MQLTETPEGKSSLQIRLDEAERRAHDAEVTAQDAQATLARTLLDAARVEAVVTARIKAESEAEIEALRLELDAAKRLSAVGEVDTPSSDEALDVKAAAAPEAAAECPSYRPIVMTEWERPLTTTDDADDAEARQPRGFGGWPTASALSPVRIVLPAIAAVLILAAYDLSGYLMAERNAASAAVASSTTAEASGANWLLYMPVERTAVTLYLGGNAKPKRQLAVKSTPVMQQRN